MSEHIASAFPLRLRGSMMLIWYEQSVGTDCEKNKTISLKRMCQEQKKGQIFFNIHHEAVQNRRLIQDKRPSLSPCVGLTTLATLYTSKLHREGGGIHSVFPLTSTVCCVCLKIMLQCILSVPSSTPQLSLILYACLFL